MNERIMHSFIHSFMHVIHLECVKERKNASGRRISRRARRLTMDFQGQRASERAAKATLAIGAVVAYARGWLAGGDFDKTMRAFAWSVAVACVVRGRAGTGRRRRRREPREERRGRRRGRDARRRRGVCSRE